VLKIDRSFVSGLIDGADDLAIVQNVIGLAKALRLTTTAEGIEERGQWTILNQLGCDNGQGYIFSRPKAADDLASLLDAEEAPGSRAAA
jgi:EAL domain-containing protein (putative c-di-GMP-specific phosphodiesterase class I)